MGFAFKVTSCENTANFSTFEDTTSGREDDAVGAFRRAFAVELAETQEMKEEAYGLRYRVYCEERGFEASAQFPNRQESDQSDTCAMHALVRHRRTAIVVGTVRLIIRDPAGNPLPLEQACADSLDLEALNRYGFRRDSIAEVSRFAVSKGAIMEVVNSERNQTPTERSGLDTTMKSFQLIALGLIAALFQMSTRQKLDHWIALMEPALARHLARLGIKFEKVGPLIEHHGRRQPMIAVLYKLRHDIQRKNKDLFELMSYLDGQRLARRAPMLQFPPEPYANPDLAN